MINGKIVDSSVWIDYFNNIIDERTDAAFEFVRNHEIIMLPIILQDVLHGVKDKQGFNWIKDAFL